MGKRSECLSPHSWGEEANQYQQESPLQDAHNGRKIAVKASNLNLGFIIVSDKQTNKQVGGK